jgi:hypothetical protein
MANSPPAIAGVNIGAVGFAMRRCLSFVVRNSHLKTSFQPKPAIMISSFLNVDA